MIDLVPNVQYTILAIDLFSLLDQFGVTQDNRVDLINKLVPFERNLFYRPSKQKKCMENPTTTPRKFLGLFKKGKKYFYTRLEIKQSSIPGAGMGVYTLENIPSGAIVPYIGVPVSGTNYNGSYSFDIVDWGKDGIPYRDCEESQDSSNGEPDEGESRDTDSGSSTDSDDNGSIFVIDSSDEEKSNWTRAINCQIDESDNNMAAYQRFDQVLLKTVRRIEKGEELFLWYGDDYITEYLSK